MALQPLLGRQLKSVGFKRLCHFEGAGHNKIIQPGKIAYQVREGECQGMFHNVHCFQAAKEQMAELKEKMNLQE